MYLIGLGHKLGAHNFANRVEHELTKTSEGVHVRAWLIEYSNLSS